MSNEIQLAHGTSGRTLYAVVRNATGSVWNTAGSAFEAYNAANWADYDVALTEQGSSGFYAGTFPVGITTAGVYDVEVRNRSGGSPATSDAVVGSGRITWSGSAVVTPALAADALLGRRLSGGADGGRTVAQALAASRNKVAFDVPSSGYFTVYDTDDSTALWTGTYSRGSNTLGPLTTTDPA